MLPQKMDNLLRLEKHRRNAVCAEYPGDGLPEESLSWKELCIDEGTLIPVDKGQHREYWESLISVIPGRTGKTIGLDQHDD
jgi:hypothetical protein